MGKLNGGFESETLLSKTQLSGAGITHVHLLPTFLFAGVDDQKENWRNVDTSVEESFPPDSDQQQALITAIQHFDGYNLGFNPVLWGVPKGSYASNPNGPNRAIEFRKMVEALNHTGLCIVLDTVYNHLQGSGPSDAHSVLDKPEGSGIGNMTSTVLLLGPSFHLLARLQLWLFLQLLFLLLFKQF
ncbi:Pullulanase 1, chloroplastic, variant 2 [Trifolium repens]|nr:Pullulanase 1, chloroplastic, variant 2 [Trifolium repens]